LAAEGPDMEPTVHDITLEQDQDLALTKLSTLGFEIDTLTTEQIAYHSDYTAGT
jgi:adenosylhomocysteinase